MSLHKQMKPYSKDYLGDSVYAQVDQLGSLVLATKNGYRASNTEDFIRVGRAANGSSLPNL
jgi:hypothetical protein